MPRMASRRALRVLLGLLRYPYGMLRDLLQGELNLRAMSLVYTTLLSLVPLLALSFSILKGFGVQNQLDETLRAAFAPLGEQKAVELTENLMDLHPVLVENPYAAKLKIDLPGAAELREFAAHLTASEPGFEQACEVSREQLADKLVGLYRVNVRGLLLKVLRGGVPVATTSPG